MTPDPNDFVAIPVTNGSMSISSIVDELENEGMKHKRETVTTQFNGGKAVLKQPRSTTFGVPVVIA